MNDLQLLSGDKMFAKAGLSNTLQSTGGLSHGIPFTSQCRKVCLTILRHCEVKGILSSFGNKQSTIPNFDLAGLNSPRSDKESGFG